MMKQSLSQNQVAQLQECVSLAQELAHHAKANQSFAELRDRVAADNPVSAELLELLWNEVLAARRSATFWREMSDVEKQLSERIAQSHLQLRQNYERLMQEQ